LSSIQLPSRFIPRSKGLTGNIPRDPKLFAREIFFQFPITGDVVDHARCRAIQLPSPLIPRSKGLTGNIPKGEFRGGCPYPGFHPRSPNFTQAIAESFLLFRRKNLSPIPVARQCCRGLCGNVIVYQCLGSLFCCSLVRKKPKNSRPRAR